MKKKVLRKGLLVVLLAFATFLLPHAPVLQAATTFTPYDDFSEGVIDSALWNNYEFVREIDNGRLWLLARSANGSTGPISNTLKFGGDVDPSTITTITATITPHQFDYGDPENPTKAMAMVGGRFYNDGTSSGPGDCTGDIIGQIGIGYTNGSPTVPKLFCSVSRFNSSDCSTTDPTPLASAVWPITVSMDTPYTVTVAWDQSTSTFTATYSGTTKTYTASGTIDPPRSLFRGLYTKVLNNTDESGGKAGFASAYFDNVYTNLSSDPYDDFSADYIARTKWSNYEFVRAIADNHLTLFARGFTGAVTENTLPVAAPNNVSAIQATVTPGELSSDGPAGLKPFIYVGGRFFNDGSAGDGFEGDIGAYVGLKRTSDGLYYIGKWKVVRFTGTTMSDFEEIAGGESKKVLPPNQSKSYNLSVAWDGTKFTFVGNKETFSFTPKTYMANATVAKAPFKGLGAMIIDQPVPGDTNIHEAKAMGYFNNVMIATSYFLTADIAGSGTVKSGPAGINCSNAGGRCSAPFLPNKQVVLTAKAATGWVFNRWYYVSGADPSCTTKTACPITMTEATGPTEMRAVFSQDPTLLVSPASPKNFGNVKVTSTKPGVVTFSVTNKTTKGAVPLTVAVSDPTIVSGNAGEFTRQNDNCTTAGTVQPNKKCTFQIAFKPSSVADGKHATITITTNDPSALTKTIDLWGNGK